MGPLLPIRLVVRPSFRILETFLLKLTSLRPDNGNTPQSRCCGDGQGAGKTLPCFPGCWNALVVGGSRGASAVSDGLISTLVARRSSLRVGIGHDTHRLEEGRPLILGGQRIAHPRGLVGHSDADVVCHAVADALLGAAGLGDIGEHYPDTDPRWKGLDSTRLLARGRRSARAVRVAGGQLRRDRPRPGAKARPAQAGHPGEPRPSAGGRRNGREREGQDRRACRASRPGEAIVCEAITLIEPAAMD